jgi:hypothetical protein
MNRTYEGQYVTLMFTDDYAKLSTTIEGLGYILDNKKKETVDSIIWDLLEDIRCNSSVTIILPEQIGALTDRTFLAEDVSYNDDGEITETGNLYTYENYYTNLETEELLKNGFIYFLNVKRVF